MTEAVCDAGPLIHLDELGWLDLLDDFAAIAVPLQVIREVERHRPGLGHDRIAEARRVEVRIERSPEFSALVRAFSLGAGEQAALSFALSRPGTLVLTDDSAARLAAKALAVRAYGTLGVLLRSIRRGQREREVVLEVLRTLGTRSTLHVRPDLLQQVIEEIEAL